MRLDRFLSVARIFKSRSLAAEAISSSMVFINGIPAKPAKDIGPGAIIEIDTPRFYKKLKVTSLPARNVGRREASMSYELIEERTKD